MVGSYIRLLSYMIYPLFITPKVAGKLEEDGINGTHRIAEDLLCLPRWESRGEGDITMLEDSYTEGDQDVFGGVLEASFCCYNYFVSGLINVLNFL